MRGGKYINEFAARIAATGAAAISGFPFVAVDGGQNPLSAIIESPGVAEWNGKIYVAYQGVQYDAFIVRIDKATKQIDQGPWRVQGTTLTNDAHGTPPVLVESDGTIHVCGGSHVTALQYSRSSPGGDITTLVNQTSPLASCSYPSWHQTSDGKIWLFYRSAGHLSAWSYITSSDHGATWSAATVFLNFGLAANDTAYAYITKDPTADEFHISYCWQDENNSLPNPYNASTIVNRYNVFYYKMTAAGVKTRIDGSAVPTFPPTLASSRTELLILNTQSTFAYCNIPVVALDPNKVPFILANVNTTPADGLGHVYKVLWWNGSAIQSSNITTTDFTLDEYQLEVVSGSLAGGDIVLRAYVVSGGSPGTNGDFDTQLLDRGGNIEEWTSAAGVGSWSKTATLAVAADTTHLYNSPVFVRGRTGSPKLFYTDWQNSLTGPFNARVYPYPASSIVTPMLAQTKALLNRISASLPAVQQFEIDNIWRNMIALGIDTKLDAFYLMGGFDAQSSRLNWLGTTTVPNLTPVGNAGAGPSFVAGQGFTGNGTDSYHSLGVNAGALSKLLQNNAEVGLWSNTAGQFAAADFGAVFSVSDIFLRVRDTTGGGAFAGRLNDVTTTSQTSVTDGSRLSIIRRASATVVNYQKNNVAPTTSTTSNSVARDTNTAHALWVGGCNLATPQFSTRQIGLLYLGAALTTAQANGFYLQVMYPWFRRRGVI